MFENFISLGSNCLIASALSKYGLRSASGPFDWCTSSLEGVLTLLENDFCDFMNYKNLRVVKENNLVFDDIKYKINYRHDIKVSLENDYVNIKEKYLRRIERFREMIKMPTCFVRGIWSMEELSFLHSAEDRICSVIKGNDIIFVVPKYIYEQNPIQSHLKIFVVDTFINGFDLGREESRSFFDTNQTLIDFLIKNYNPEKRKDNLIFDLKAELHVAQSRNTDASSEKEINHLKEKIVRMRQEQIELESRLARWMQVINTDYSSIEHSGKIAIYGHGAIGRTLYNYMKNNFNIIEFIDKKPRQDIYNGVPVNTIENAISDSKTLIIVVPSYEYDKIRLELIEKIDSNLCVLSVEEFLAKGKVSDPYF